MWDQSTSRRRSEIPVFIGLKYFTSGQPKGFYYAQDLGPIFTTAVVRVRTDDEALAAVATRSSDTNVCFGGAVGIGYRISDFDLRASVFTVRYDKADKTSAVMATVSYSFAEF